MKVLHIFILLLVTVSLLLGCGTIKKTWRDTKKYYNSLTSITVSPHVEGVDADSLDIDFAKTVSSVDKAVDDLLRHMQGRKLESWEEEIKQLQAAFPWVTGFMLIDRDGEAQYQYPEVSIKPVNVTPFLEGADEMIVEKLFAYVDRTAFGPEVYLGSPQFTGHDLTGVLVVHFDPRTLVNTFSHNPEELMIMAKEDVLWDGGDEAGAKALFAQVDAMFGSVSGTISSEGKQYMWLLRYVGDMPLIYVSELSLQAD